MSDPQGIHLSLHPPALSPGLRAEKTVHLVEEASGVLWRCQAEIRRLRSRAAGEVGPAWTQHTFPGWLLSQGGSDR